MAMAYQATLNSVNLPLSFSYSLYVPRKRMTTTPTAGAVILQEADDLIVHGDGTLSWTIQVATPAEFKVLYDLYNTASLTEYQFTGYWDDDLQVQFVQLDSPTVRGRIFSVSGMFQVISVTTEYSALACGGV